MAKKKKTKPAPGAGHNSAGVTTEVFNKHLTLIETAEAERDTINKKMTTLRKAARTDGIILGIFDAERKLVELPRSEQIHRWEFSLACKRFLRNPVGAQMKLNFDSVDPFKEDDAAALARIAADAEADGYRAGLAGVKWEKDNPHTPDTPEGQGWIKGYREGQTNRAEALGDDADTRS